MHYIKNLKCLMPQITSSPLLATRSEQLPNNKSKRIKLFPSFRLFLSFKKEFFNNNHMLLTFSPILSFCFTTFAIMNAIFTFHIANGYDVERILSLNDYNSNENKNLFATSSLLKSPYYTSYIISPSQLQFSSSNLFLNVPTHSTLSDLPENKLVKTNLNIKNLIKRKHQPSLTNLSVPEYFISVNKRNDYKSLKNNVSFNKLLNHKIQNAYTKKSSFVKSLKKFSRSGARNCFFTPIQCMIQHDMSKYKKIFDSNSIQGTTLAKL